MVRASSTITSKGQITLPIALRRLLNLKEGDRVEFDLDSAGEVRLRPAKQQGRFGKYKGAGVGHLKTKEQAEEWLNTLRGREE